MNVNVVKVKIFTRHLLSDRAAPKYISFYTRILNTVQYIDQLQFDQHIYTFDYQVI